MIPDMNFALMLPELVLIATGILVLMLDAFLPRAHEGAEPRGAILGVTLAGLVVAGALIALRPEAHAGSSFEGLFVVDGFSDAIKLVVLLGTALCALLCDTWLRNHRVAPGAFFSLVLFSTTGMLYLTSATDMVMLFLGLELMSIPMYCLSAALRWDERSVEAGVKYLVLGSFATAVMLMGFALLYAFTGTEAGLVTTRLDLIADAIVVQAKAGALPGYVYVGGLLSLVGMLFKLSAVPFHMWTPDVYEGAPTAITAWMSVVVKTVTCAVLLRIFPTDLLVVLGLDHVLWVVAAATMFLGNTMALTQDNLKRLLAYASIAHGGYMLVAVLAGGEAGAAAVVFYAGAYTIATIATFGVLQLLSEQGHEVERLDDLAGVGTRWPLLGAVMVVAMLSLPGIPPFAGFFGKFSVFRAAVGEGYVVLTIIGVLTSAISLAYYLRPIMVMFMVERVAPLPVLRGRVWSVQVALGVSAALTLLLGLLPSGALDFAMSSVQSLVAAP